MPYNEERIEWMSCGYRLVALKVMPGGALPAKGRPVVVVVHGAMDYKEHFIELAQALAAAGLAAVLPDMRGHGESGGDRYHVRMTDWVADLRSLLTHLATDERLNTGRLGGFGFSSGGTAVLEAAVEGVPFGALVTLDATVRSILKWYEKPAFALGSALGSLKLWLTGRPLHVPLEWAVDAVPVAVDEQVCKQVAGDPYVRAAYRRFPLPGALEAFSVDTLKRVHRIRCPVLILHGEEDQLDPPESARLLAAHLMCPHTLKILPGSGHVGHLDQARRQVLRLTCDWFVNRL